MEKKFENFVVKTKRKVRHLGLALGGGGSRGYAHLGVLKAFEEKGIVFDYVAGTSVGALVGAFYCAGFKVDEIVKIACALKETDIRKNVLPFMPCATSGIEEVIKSNLGDINIEDLKIPFCAVAVDVRTGAEVHITSGNLAKAVAGSCAVPAIFNPVDFENYLLFDGGLQNTIPSNVPKIFGCDRTIAVDIYSSRGSGTNSNKFFDLLGASIGIMMKSNAIKGYLNADLMIKPNVARFKNKKLDGMNEMISEGYKATIEKMPEVIELLKKKDKKQLIKEIKKSIHNDAY